MLRLCLFCLCTVPRHRGRYHWPSEADHNLERGETLKLRQSFCYEAQRSGGKAGLSGPSTSGAYIFSPADDEPYDLGMHATHRIIKVYCEAAASSAIIGYNEADH
ncbi:hypothetical protein V5799_028011 [Amblyomma americanum]|uniref:Uncharacterized protein n=1 Tax=Amblyomma americanum TaxID=6943 RepID=A0AAQ4DE32_AMBAM